jgi:hypothetical protein
VHQSFLVVLQSRLTSDFWSKTVQMLWHLFSSKQKGKGGGGGKGGLQEEGGNYLWEFLFCMCEFERIVSWLSLG